ncbi:hypothetical protein ACFVY9_36080 [Streptomyces sp. NPDC059544]|uniref:hypothetical protein n=1 Tax=Streptomyces sp. NPDC059544 TaxID=3346861 RepID=UPI0036BCC55A
MVTHARWQAQEWGADGPRIVSISPGVISTGLLHAMFTVRGAAPDHGARNVIEAATGPMPHSGAYIDDGRPARPNPQVEDPVFRDRLRKVTSRLLTHWLCRTDVASGQAPPVRPHAARFLGMKYPGKARPS